MQTTEILDRLKQGNTRFVDDAVKGELRDRDRRSTLTKGQEPFAIILSCADSRVVPELAFDTGVGELFVIRVAGNIANTSSIASIEYAVANLGTSVIVVMGHESCGAVTAARAGGGGSPHLDSLLAQIEPACRDTAGEDLAVVVRKNAELSAQNLVEKSKIIRDAISEGRLIAVPAYYELASGEVQFASPVPATSDDK